MFNSQNSLNIHNVYSKTKDRIPGYSESPYLAECIEALKDAIYAVSDNDQQSIWFFSNMFNYINQPTMDKYCATVTATLIDIRLKAIAILCNQDTCENIKIPIPDTPREGVELFRLYAELLDPLFNGLSHDLFTEAVVKTIL